MTGEHNSMYHSYDDLVNLIANSGKDYDVKLIEQAYLFANEAHAGQVRKSGQPYIIHPISVAYILVELGMDTECIVAALLHDVIEDTPVELNEVIEKFGKRISVLIDGVTKLEKITHSSRGGLSREETQAENLRKMLFAMNEDIRVIIIKLADRLNNIRTLGALPPQKQRDIARETMEVFAPLAHRMGMRKVKEELEDTSLRYLDGVGYQAISELLSRQLTDRDQFLANLEQTLEEKIKQSIPNVVVYGRIKSVNGIYRKMYIQGKDFSEIFDIYAVRVIVDTVEECYVALGIIHNVFIMVRNRFKDYITMPKPNGYQSLHTTVLGKQFTENGRTIPFEVQIRTQQMHYKAEFGIAAHWKYKQGLKGSDSLDEYVGWIRRQIENQLEDSSEPIVIPQTDEVYVLTPKGDTKALPRGATCIDFAYAIHSAVGHRMIGAKINGRIVPINSVIHDGDMVEIITAKDPNHGPNRDWLNIVRTGEARTKIRTWFKNERREENIEEGRETVEREFKRNGIRLPDDKMQEFLGDLAVRARLESVDDFYAAIGYGGIVLSKLMQRIRDDYQKLMKSVETVSPEDMVTKQPVKRGAADGVYIEGVDNCLIKMSKCCGPMPGDEIIGFITRGYGVSIHKRSCSNVPVDIEKCEEPERWVKAVWSDQITVKEFKSTLHIECHDRKGLLADVTVLLSNMHVPINMLNSRQTKNGEAIISVTIVVTGKEHLEQICKKLANVKGVISISR